MRTRESASAGRWSMREIEDAKKQEEKSSWEWEVMMRRLNHPARGLRAKGKGKTNV